MSTEIQPGALERLKEGIREQAIEACAELLNDAERFEELFDRYQAAMCRWAEENPDKPLSKFRWSFQIKLGLCPVVAFEHALLPELHCPGLPMKELGPERVIRSDGGEDPFDRSQRLRALPADGDGEAGAE